MTNQIDTDAMETYDIRAALDPANRMRYTRDQITALERELRLRTALIYDGRLSFTEGGE